METFGLLFLIGGALLLRQVVTGRVHNTGEDIKSLFSAALSGDTGSAESTLSLRGSNLPGATDSVASVAPGSPNVPPVALGSSSLLDEMVRLGNAAKGYRWSASGPDWYDCSGLVWKAMTNLKLYNGGRFTTHTFQTATKNVATQVATPAVGDVVLWPGEHMGVVSGTDRMYSAMSPDSGIRTASISASQPTFHTQPLYFRIGGAK